MPLDTMFLIQLWATVILAGACKRPTAHAHDDTSLVAHGAMEQKAPHAHPVSNVPRYGDCLRAGAPIPHRLLPLAHLQK